MDEPGVRRAALVVATLSSFMTPFMGSSINVALPAIAKEFKMDAVVLSWIPTSYLLATAVSLVPFGRLADIHGRKRIYTYGIFLFTLFSFLCTMSPSVPYLIFFRILQGIGSAMIFATGIAILTSVFPPQQRGRVLGINVAAVYIGLSLGPFLGGFLTEQLTWRAVFLAHIPLGLIILALLLWKVKPEWAEARGEPFDLTGSLIYAVAITGLVYGMSLLPHLESLWIMLFGFSGLLGFIAWETKTKKPVFDLELFKTNRVFAFSNLAALINYSATFAITFLLSLYLQQIRAYSPQGAGLILVAQPVVMALLSPMAGRFSDRIEPRIVASLGMILTSLGLFLFVLLEQESSLQGIILRLVLLGVGFALFSSPNTNAIMGSVERRFYGIASGSVSTMRVLGMMISMGIATVLFALFIGRVQITPEYHPALMRSIKTAFLIFAVLCLGGVFASMVRGNLRKGA
jgi:EmrB/QacA subfamily drug resistance transporter